MKDFESLCRSRRSIRKFKDMPVEAEKLDSMLRCALMSPSSKRCNPWEFYVVQDTALIRRMAGCKTYGAQMMETAQAAVVVAVDASLTDTWQADGAIAAEHLLLAAEDLGLGACWCQVYGRDNAEELIRQIAGIPSSLSVLCVIALGYKDEERRPYDPDKLLYNKIHNCPAINMQ